MTSTAPTPNESPGSPVEVTPPPTPADLGPIRQSERPRIPFTRGNGPAVLNLVKVFVGGTVGLVLAVLVLWYGAGIDVLGLTSGSPEPPFATETSLESSKRRLPSDRRAPPQEAVAESTVTDEEPETPSSLARSLEHEMERPGLYHPSRAAGALTRTDEEANSDASSKPELQAALLKLPKLGDPSNESDGPVATDRSAKLEARASAPTAFRVRMKKVPRPRTDLPRCGQIRPEVERNLKPLRMNEMALSPPANLAPNVHGGRGERRCFQRRNDRGTRRSPSQICRRKLRAVRPIKRVWRQLGSGNAIKQTSRALHTARPNCRFRSLVQLRLLPWRVRLMFAT